MVLTADTLATLTHFSTSTVHTGAASIIFAAVAALGAAAGLVALMVAARRNAATDAALADAARFARLDMALRVRAAKDASLRARRAADAALTALVLARLQVHASDAAAEERATLIGLYETLTVLRATRVRSTSRKVA